jgi:hypothetical protein
LQRNSQQEVSTRHGKIINNKYNFKKLIEEILSLYEGQREMIGFKISADLLSSCFNRIDEGTVKGVI